MKIQTLFVILSVLLLIFILPCKLKASSAIEAINSYRNKHKIAQYEKYGFICTSTGGGGDGKRYRHLKIGFDTHDELTVDQARKYIVESVVSFVEELNKDTNLKIHFVDWPFSYDKLTYTISVSSGNGMWPRFPNGPTPDKKISYVEYTNGTIDYLIDVHPRKLPEVIHSETFDEAIAILKAEGWTEPKN